MSAFSSPTMRKRDALGARTRSVPALTKAYGLRDMSFSKKLLAMEYVRVAEDWPHDTLKDRERRWRLSAQAGRLEKRDEDERGLVAAEIKRQKRQDELERERRMLHRERVHNQRRASMVAAWKVEQEALQKADEERLEKQREETEAEENRWQSFQDTERLKRKPVNCKTCAHTGICQDCKGNRVHSATFLTSTPGQGAQDLEFGVKTRGCESCFGCDQGIRGPLYIGSGKCFVCAGAGKFCTGLCHKPIPSREKAMRRLGTRATRHSFTSDSISASAPMSPCTPKTRFGRAATLAAEKSDEPEACPICRGSIRPKLSDAEWHWASCGLLDSDSD